MKDTLCALCTEDTVDRARSLVDSALRNEPRVIAAWTPGKGGALHASFHEESDPLESVVLRTAHALHDEEGGYLCAALRRHVRAHVAVWRLTDTFALPLTGEQGRVVLENQVKRAPWSLKLMVRTALVPRDAWNLHD